MWLFGCFTVVFMFATLMVFCSLFVSIGSDGDLYQMMHWCCGALPHFYASWSLMLMFATLLWDCLLAQKKLCCVRLLCSEIICLHKKMRWVGLLCSRIVCLQKKKCWVGTIIYVVGRSQHPLHLVPDSTIFISCVWLPAYKDSSYELTMACPVFGPLYLVILARTHRYNLNIFVCTHSYVEIDRT